MPQLTLNDLDWVYTQTGGVLHHATFDAEAEAEMEDYANAMGLLDCQPNRGLVHVSIPGFLSRMSMKRCLRCCDRNGYPYGLGSPKNDNRIRVILDIPERGSDRPAE
jgi:hypothetical protein